MAGNFEYLSVATVDMSFYCLNRTLKMTSVSRSFPQAWYWHYSVERREPNEAHEIVTGKEAIAVDKLFKVNMENRKREQITLVQAI